MLNNQLISVHNAYTQGEVVLPDTIKELVIQEKWQELDDFFLKATRPSGFFFKQLKNYVPTLKNVEFIINIRDAANEYEEDGIWHDDGSRVFAFSLGLNLNPKHIKGGELYIRKKQSESYEVLNPPPFGTCYYFKTGIDGYEHKIKAVSAGKRIVIAGWCSL